MTITVITTTITIIIITIGNKFKNIQFLSHLSPESWRKPSNNWKIHN
jgi:hypothetical protein